MENLKIWDKLKVVPTEAQKTIAGGRLKGMTDINPQWRLHVMTEIFGVCGIGWYYTIEKQWLEPGDAENVCAFCNINLYVKNDNDEWSMPIPGTGGSSYIAKEKYGIHTSDEAYKMALTDALSVAMKAIGVGATVYSGGNDYSKYTQSPNKQTTGNKTSQPTQPLPKQENVQQDKDKQPTNTISDKQVKRLWAIASKSGISNKDAKAVIMYYGFESSEDITKDKYEKIVSEIENFVSVEMIGG